MYEAEDHEFFDELYRLWSQTTGAKDHYLIPIPLDPDDYRDYANYRFDIIAVPFNEEEGDRNRRKFIGSVMTEADADFICGLHGAMPDLIRRLHEAIDEAVRKDEENDIAQGALADVLLENTDLRNQLYELEKQ